MDVIPGAKTVEEEVVKGVIRKIKNIYNCIKKYHHNLEQLKKTREELVDNNADITRQVEIGEQKLEEPTEITKTWLDEVKELLDGAKTNELIDEKIREANDKCCFGLFLCNIVYRYQTSKAAVKKTEEMRGKISPTPYPVTLPIDPMDFEPPTEYLAGLKSRDELVDEILKKLKDVNVNSVALWGMGAIGKTTLAKEVKKAAKGSFDLIAMAEVSKEPNIDRIQAQLAESIGLPLTEFTTAVRAEKLHTKLNTKGGMKEDGGKILIILDNVWTKLNLCAIGIPLEQTKEVCCKILFTCREENVCEVMGVKSDNIISIPLLTEEEAKYLFHKRIGKADVSGEYKAVADRLLKMCGGLPLPIAVIADALRGKDLRKWHHFAHKLETKQEDKRFSNMYDIILETSIEFIDNEDKKKFFMLACLFPLGSNILLDDMIRYGIGLDLFQHVSNLSEEMEEGQRWANELRSSSLLLGNESEKFVKIHDFFRECAIHYAAKGDQRMRVEAAPKTLRKETWADYTAISLTSVCDYINVSGLESGRLEILMLQGETMVKNYNFDEKFFAGMINLKVLALRKIKIKESLPESIATLKNLQTLLMEGCELYDLKLIGELKKLLVLSFKGSKMTELPVEIGNLCNLQIMDLRNCRIRDGKIPAGVISRLSQLGGFFTCYNLHKWANVEAGSSTAVLSEQVHSGSSQASISEFKSLSLLSVLEVYIRNTAQLPTSDKFMENVKKFKIFVGIDNLYKDLSPQASNVLVINNLGFNQISKYSLIEVLLRKTEFLELSHITGLKRLAYLNHDNLKGLKHLQVEGCTDLRCILSPGIRSGMEGFPNLESLSLSDIPELESISDGVVTSGMFANLRDVSLKHLSKLQMHALPMILAHQLTSIKVEACLNLNFIFSGTEEELSSPTVFSSLKKLILIDLPKLRNLLGEANSSTSRDHPNVCQHLLKKEILLPLLDELEVYNVPIRQLWDSAPYKQTCTSVDALANGGSNIVSCFDNLKHVRIIACDKLESLGPPSVATHLLHLETLYIESCTKMSEVLAKDADVENTEQYVSVFPKLGVLTLFRLWNLKYLYGGNHQLEFNALKKIQLQDLPQMVSIGVAGESTTFFNDKIKFPQLIDLTMREARKEVDEGKALLRPTLMSNPLPQLRNLELIDTRGLSLVPAIAFQKLSNLKLERCDYNFAFSTSTPSSEGLLPLADEQLPNLEDLVLYNCGSMEDLFEYNQAGSTSEHDVAVRMICGHLRKLKLSSMGKMNPLPLRLFTNLRSLDIYHLKWECLFTSELVTLGIENLFPLLEDITICDCETMKVLLDDESGDGEDIKFPRLKRIKLKDMNGAKSFNCRANSTLVFPFLEELEIDFSDFQSVFLGPVNLPNLRTVKLLWCKKMTMVFNVTELLSLMSLDIEYCPHLQSFSEEPLDAPLLKKIQIDEHEYPVEHVDQINPINSILKHRHEERMRETEKEMEEEKNRNKTPTFTSFAADWLEKGRTEWFPEEAETKWPEPRIKDWEDDEESFNFRRKEEETKWWPEPRIEDWEDEEE